MKLPKVIPIRRGKWRVVVEPSLAEEGYHGCTYNDTREIHIGAHLRGKFRDEVFVHELLHACMPPRKRVVRPSTEEKVVNVLARELTRVMRRLRWIR